MSDIHSLGIQGSILTPLSPSYETANQRYSPTAVLKPSYIVVPATADDVVLALRFARSQNPPLELAVKGGGCHTATVASSQDGLIIDLSGLKSVSVSSDKSSVTVGGGALWGDVYAETDKHGVVVVGGNIHFVGVGGFTLAGGYSLLSGKYGLAVDNLIQATVVLADGRIIDTSETNEPDLFWAIRGGSNQFGIVTEFVFKAYPLASSATVGVMVYPGTELADVLRALRTYLQIQDKTSKMILAFARAPPHFYPGLLILPYIEDVHKTDAILAPFREIVKPIFEGVGPAPNFSAVAHAADDSLKGVPPRQIIDGALFSDLWEDVVSKAFGDWIQFTEQPQFRATVCMWEFWHQEKIAETDVGKMAFAARDPHYYVVVTGRHTEESDDSTVAEWTSNLAAAVRQAQVEKTGKKLTTPSSFCLDPKYESVEDIYGENLPKLKKLKAKYDPEKIWSKGWLIEPDFT